MPHFEMLVASRTGEYMAYVEADSPEAAKAQIEGDNARYTVHTVEERERCLGWTLVMGGDGTYGKWGCGPTEADAKVAFRRSGGVLSKGYEVITFDEETDFCGVDEMGRYTTVRKDYDWSNGRTANPVRRVVKPKARS